MLTVQNHTKQTLVMFINNSRIGYVYPNSNSKFGPIRDGGAKKNTILYARSITGTSYWSYTIKGSYLTYTWSLK
jgi:hypothetical protein